jgi:hypothetical protein
MKTTWTNTDGTFPSIVSKNSTTGTSKDGTPINKDLVDELFGMMQAIVYDGNVTPSDSVELYNSSDVVYGIRNISGSPGDIVFRYKKDDTIGERLLYLNGSTVLVSNYPDLVERSYCGDSYNATAEGFFRCNNSDGTGRSTSGTYLYLPDFRGYFIRCHGGYYNGVDPDNRYIGSIQNDGIKDHEHDISNSYNGYFMNMDTASLSSGGTLYIQWLTTATSDKVIASDSSDTNSDETRPINRTLYAYVRY